MNSRTTISALGARLRSPRTLLAIVVSVVATAGVGGPLAYEAYHARDLLAAERAGAENRDASDDGTNGDDSNGDGTDGSNADELADGSTTTVAPGEGSDGSDGSDGSGGSDGSATTAVPGATGTVVTPTTTPGASGSGATTAPPSPPLPVPTTVPENDLVILVSVSSQLVPASPLAGKQATGRVYVFIDVSLLDPALGRTVQWALDGSAVRLPGGQLDTAGLAVGAHTLTASIGTPIGTLIGSATFTVAR